MIIKAIIILFTLWLIYALGGLGSVLILYYSGAKKLTDYMKGFQGNIVFVSLFSFAYRFLLTLGISWGFNFCNNKFEITQMRVLAFVIIALVNLVYTTNIFVWAEPPKTRIDQIIPNEIMIKSLPLPIFLFQYVGIISALIIALVFFR